MSREKIIEVMAASICEKSGYRPDVYISPPEDPRLYWEMFVSKAEAALNALESAGYVVVPRDRWVPSGALADNTDASWIYHDTSAAKDAP